MKRTNKTVHKGSKSTYLTKSDNFSNSSSFPWRFKTQNRAVTETEFRIDTFFGTKI